MYSEFTCTHCTSIVCSFLPVSFGKESKGLKWYYMQPSAYSQYLPLQVRIHSTYVQNQCILFPPSAFVLTAQFDKVKGVDIRSAESARNAAYKEQLMAEDVAGKDKYSNLLLLLPSGCTVVHVFPCSPLVNGASAAGATIKCYLVTDSDIGFDLVTWFLHTSQMVALNLKKLKAEGTLSSEVPGNSQSPPPQIEAVKQTNKQTSKNK